MPQRRSQRELLNTSPISNQLQTKGIVPVEKDLLMGTDFIDAFVHIHTLSGEPGELIAKRDCFGWYILGQVNSSRIGSVEVRTVSIEEDIAMKVTSEELDNSQPEWYLPLQAVFTPERTTKVCLVFDACSKGHKSFPLTITSKKDPIIM